MEKKLLKRILELSGQPLNELFVNAPEIETDEDILRLSIVAELDAVSLYKKFAKKTMNKNIKKVILDIVKEEEIHIGEFEKLLIKINPDYEKNKKKGEKEVEETNE